MEGWAGCTCCGLGAMGHGSGRNTKRDKDEDEIQDLGWMEAER
jgi:hypothetical protein